MITIKEIEKKTMSEEKKRTAKNNIFAFYVGRPISYFFTIPFIYLDIKPNVITVISMMFSVAGFVFTAFPVFFFFPIIGWVCYFLWNIFDGVDGNVARYKKQFSKNGSLFDATAGYLQLFLSFFSYGISAYFLNGYLINELGIPPYLFIIFGAFSSFFTIFPRLIMQKKKSENGDESVKSIQDKGSYSVVSKIALNVCSASGFIQILMMTVCVFAIFGIFLFDIFTIAYLAINLLFMVTAVLKLLLR